MFHGIKNTIYHYHGKIVALADIFHYFFHLSIRHRSSAYMLIGAKRGSLPTCPICQFEWISLFLNFEIAFYFIGSSNFGLRVVLQYIREAHGHKERKGHPRIAWKLEETVSIL